MKPSFSDENAVFTKEVTCMHQYDTLAKKVLRGEARSYIRRMSQRSEQEISIDEITDCYTENLYVTDEYPSDYNQFHAYGYDVIIRNDLLAEAISDLPERMQKIILLFYGQNMSDAEIGRLLHVVRSTVYRNRKTALGKLKEYMEGR